MSDSHLGITRTGAIRTMVTTTSSSPWPSLVIKRVIPRITGEIFIIIRRQHSPPPGVLLDTVVTLDRGSGRRVARNEIWSKQKRKPRRKL